MKLRLTGAIILVFVVVMLVPEMFRGQPEGLRAHGEAAPGDLPVHRVNIDLRNDLAPPIAVAPAPGPVAVPNTQGAHVAEIAAAATQPATPVANAVVGAPGDTALAPSPSPSPSPAVVTPPRRAVGHWTVQVGTFARRDFAERMVKQLHAKGFAVVAAGPDDRGLYRVRSAIMSSRASADALRQKMVQKGLKPIIDAAP